MKKGLLIVTAISASSLAFPVIQEASAQGPGPNNSSLSPAIAPPRPSHGPASSSEGSERQFGGSGGDRENNPERQEFRQKMMQRFDANHDGQLDDAERAQMKEVREQRWKEREGGNGPGADDKSNQRPGLGQGDKNSDSPQRQEFRQKMIQRFDANRDGQLDDGERAQMREFMQQRRMQRNNGSGGQP